MIRINSQIFIWLTIILLASSCKKDDLPPDNVGSTVFQSNFSFDGNPYQLVAGEDGLSMEVNTYFLEDTIVFESALDSAACEACGPGLYLQLISPDLVPDWGSQSFESRLTGWEYAFAQESEGDSTLNVFASSTGDPGIWSLNGVPQSSEALTEFEFEIENYGAFEIKLESNSAACGVPATQNVLFTGVVPCFANLFRGSGQNMNLFTAVPLGGFGTPDEFFIWTYGDTIVTTLVPSFNAPNLVGINEMCVFISEQGGCSETVCINLAPNPTSCVTNFTIDSMQVKSPVATLNKALLNLTFVDNNNVVYVSSNQVEDQPSFTNIQLLEASPYTEPTEPNRSFIKLRFEIQCLLYDALGNGKVFNGIVETAFEDPGL